MMAKDTRRPYNWDEFVPRPEIDRIVRTVEDLARGRPMDLRAFSLRDESGMGKTWALRHLCEVVLVPDGNLVQPPTVGRELHRMVPGARSLYVDLLEWSSRFHQETDPETTIKHLILRISKQISEWRHGVSTGIRDTDIIDIGKVQLTDLGRWLEADVRQFAHESVLVLLLDQVHEAPWPLLESLDQYLLGPLASIPRVLPVVAGRGQGYPWVSPEMQLRCELLKLQPFTKEQTQEQIIRQVPEEDRVVRAETVHALSGGYPRLSYAIATLGERAGLIAELDTVLAVVSEETTREQLKEYLGAICVLRSFDDDRTVAMMAAWNKVITRRQATDVRKALMKHSFAFWPEKGTGWVLDGSLRFARERLLRLQVPQNLYEKFHRAAFELYESWCKEYPKTADTWRPETEYHALQLKALELRELQHSEGGWDEE